MFWFSNLPFLFSLFTSNWYVYVNYQTSWFVQNHSELGNMHWRSKKTTGWQCICWLQKHHHDQQYTFRWNTASTSNATSVLYQLNSIWIPFKCMISSTLSTHRILRQRKRHQSKHICSVKYTFSRRHVTHLLIGYWLS